MFGTASDIRSSSLQDEEDPHNNNNNNNNNQNVNNDHPPNSKSSSTATDYIPFPRCDFTDASPLIVPGELTQEIWTKLKAANANIPVFERESSNQIKVSPGT